MDEQIKQIKKFKELPALHKDEKILATITLVIPFSRAPDFEVEALGFPLGSTVKSIGRMETIEFEVYATGEVADQVVELPSYTKITAEMKCVFGTCKVIEQTKEGPLIRTGTVSGFLIEAIKNIEEPESLW